jgi:hypothetical protein
MLARRRNGPGQRLRVVIEAEIGTHTRRMVGRWAVQRPAFLIVAFEVFQRRA